LQVYSKLKLSLAKMQQKQLSKKSYLFADEGIGARGTRGTRETRETRETNDN
jgi:hypothetical protein